MYYNYKKGDVVVLWNMNNNIVFIHNFEVTTYIVNSISHMY